MNTKIKIILLFLNISQLATGQVFYWATQSQHATVTEHGLCTDKYNNTCITGDWSGSTALFSPVSLNSTGYYNDFLVKYDTLGNVKWATCMATSGVNCFARGYAICSDSNSNIYETGYYQGNAKLGTLSISSPYKSLMFIAKYNSNGTPLWANSVTTTPTDKLAYAFGTSVTCDNKNNVIVTGTFRDTVYWGTNLLLGGSENGFLAKYDSNGNLLWATVIINDITSPGNCEGSSVTTDAFGNIYATGEFTYSVYLGYDTLVSTPGGGPNLYFAKYDPNGNLLWAQAINAITNDYVTPVVVDKSNNVYVGGQFLNDTNSSTPLLTIGSYSFENRLSHSGSNSFLAKFTPSGSPVWAVAAAPISKEEMSVIWIQALAIGRCNNVYWEGISSDSIVVGSYRNAIPSTIHHNDSTHFDFVVKLDSNGNSLSGVVLADNNDVANNIPYAGIAIDRENNIAFSGKLETTLMLGKNTVTNSDSAGSCYTTKFSLPGNCCGSVHISVSGNDTVCHGQSITLVGSGGSAYLWSNGVTTSSITITPDSSQPFSLNVSSPTCSTDTNLILSVLPVPLITISNAQSICAGTSVTLNASGGGSYIWSNGSTGSSIVVTPPTSVVYSVTVSNGRCSSTDSTEITVHQYPIPVISSTQYICPGKSDMLFVSGGTSYIWSNGDTTAQITITPLIDTTYLVTLYNGPCKLSDSVKVILNSVPVITACCDTTIIAGNSVALSATGGLGYSWYPANGLSCNTCASPIASPDVNTTYTLVVTSDSGCTSAQTITIDVNCGTVFIPEAFSPNGDGQNDVLYVRGDCIKTMQFEIFDRWGNKVFETESKSVGWDGICRGEAMNTGSYVYYLKATLYDGSTTEKHGDITLVR